MNILIINCSPVRTGATAAIADMIRAQMPAEHTVRAVCIDDYAIQCCTGCRSCHAAARCIRHDGAQQLMAQFEWADKLVAVSPSYWADVPGQFKVFIDRCTPWCNTHEPHACLAAGKQGYAVALRTGPGMAECERIIGTIEHFYGHLEIARCGHLGLCGVENKRDALDRRAEIEAFCRVILET